MDLSKLTDILAAKHLELSPIDKETAFFVLIEADPHLAGATVEVEKGQFNLLALQSTIKKKQDEIALLAQLVSVITDVCKDARDPIKSQIKG